MQRIRRCLVVMAIVLAAFPFSAQPASAAQLLRCVGSATWTFGGGITVLVGSGTVTMNWTITCIIVHEPSGDVTVENRAGTTPFSYAGNCAAMALTLFGVPAGTIVGEAVAEVTTTLGSIAANSLTFVFDSHTLCSGQTTLQSVWDVTEVQPFFT